MHIAPADRVVLDHFRKAIDHAYGSRVERAILFGSRARGDARPDSDYDIAVFIHHPEELDDDGWRLARIGTDILYGFDAVVNAFPFPAGAYNERSGFMSEVRRDGIDF
jgi:predicted nucleotidyltransferase